jgi:hypothetical protein
MAEVHTIEHRGSEKLRGRDRRSLNLSTKLTAVEAKAIEDAASRAGKTPSEWAREMLLRSDVVGQSHRDGDAHLHRTRRHPDALDGDARTAPTRRENGPRSDHYSLPPGAGNEGSESARAT